MQRELLPEKLTHASVLLGPSKPVLDFYLHLLSEHNLCKENCLCLKWATKLVFWRSDEAAGRARTRDSLRAGGGRDEGTSVTSIQA